VRRKRKRKEDEKSNSGGLGLTMKEFSARKFMVVAIISTYCFVIIGCLILTLSKIMELPVFLALISGLGTTTMYIIKAYFDDKKRPEDNGTKTP